MTDLMKDSYSYDDLANKYGNFRLPAAKIFLNGTDIISSMGLCLNEISVVLSASSASSARFKIGDIYDREKRSFDSQVVDKFKPGTIVEIGLGYYSSILKIMKGFVYMLGADFGEKSFLVVTVMDVRKLMMISGTKQLLHDVKNYSDAFKTVMSPYSKLCTVKTETTDDKLTKPVSQIGTDYDFVEKELIGRSNREFLVVGDTAYFRERPKTGSPVIQAEYGRELLKLEMDYSYLDLKIEVIGYHQYEQAVYTGKASVKSSEAQSSLISPAPVYTVTDPDADSQEKAAGRAGYLADKEKDSSKYGKGITIGLPELVPGRYLEIVKLEKMVNKKYYINEVTHRMGDGFYTTEFEAGGWI